MSTNTFAPENGFTLILHRPACDHCGTEERDIDSIGFRGNEINALMKAGMYTGHPANFWEDKTIQETCAELYKLKAAMLKRPYEYMMLMRARSDDRYASYEDLIFKIDRFILAYNKKESKDFVYVQGSLGHPR